VEGDNLYFYTVSGAAKRLKVHKSTFRRWMDRGLINFVCLIDRSKKRKFLIKQETINEILVRGIVQEELERAYEQECEQKWQKRQKYYPEHKSWEPDAFDEE
jgi:excisionase family DNA binding protein